MNQSCLAIGRRDGRRLRRALTAALLAMTLPVLVATEAQQPRQPRAYERGVLIEFRGVITPLLEQYVRRQLRRAKEYGADVVVLEMDSPGGFLDPSLKLAETMRDLDWARTVTFVRREAISGAAIVALGCDEIVMTEHARFGDAGPIIQGEDNLFRHAPEKIRSHLARDVRDLAAAKGRPPALAEAMVDMDLVVYRAKNTKTGEEQFFSEAELESLPDRDDWEVGEPVLETRKKHFLTVNGRQAVELRLADGVVETREALADRYQLKEPLLVLRPTGVDTAVTILNLPIVTGLLFVIGLVALYIEFSAPGLGMGGLIAGLCFALFFWSRFLGGTGDWLDVILFVAGVVFLAVELFVFPGFGIAGLTGMLLIIVSIFMAGQEFLIPRTERQLDVFMQTLTTVAASGILFVTIAVALGKYLKLMPGVRLLILEPPQPAPADGEGSATDRAKGPRTFPVEVGDQGIAHSPLRPAGVACFGDHFIDVVTEGGYVDAGRTVRVIEISGNRVVVRQHD